MDDGVANEFHHPLIIIVTSRGGAQRERIIGFNFDFL